MPQLAVDYRGRHRAVSLLARLGQPTRAEGVDGLGRNRV
jgi:hypothetical protein